MTTHPFVQNLFILKSFWTGCLQVSYICKVSTHRKDNTHVTSSRCIELWLQ